MKKRFTLSVLVTFMLVLLFNFKLQAQSCEAGFSYTPPNPNGLVVFQDTSWSQDQILSWTWDFGNGTVGQGPICTVQYTANGTYQVCLIIESATCIDTVCNYVAVTLANPCTITGAIYLIGPPPQNTLSADFTGGTPPYSYSWNNGATTQTITATANMNYCVTVNDAAGCSSTACYNYSSNCNMFSTIVADTISNSLNAVVTLGTFPYTYLWSNGATTPQIITNGTGNFCVTITDAQGCTTTNCYDYSPCPTPTNLQAVVTGGGTANLFWNSNGSTVTDFEFAFTTSSTPPSSGTLVASNSTSVGGLIPNTNYCLHVRAYCNVTNSYSNWSTSCFTICPNVFTYTQTSPGVYLFVSNAAPTAQTIWDFGDGSPIDTIIGNQITHTYVSTMSYQVCMTEVGCAPYCMPIYAQGNPTSVLCGTVFNDANGNSIIDTTETGLGGIYLFIYGAGTQQTAFSDSVTGNFSFNLPAGSYTVQLCSSGSLLQNSIITVPAPLPTVPPNNCASYNVTIGANDTICGLNFGVFTNASTVSGTLFYDINNNGILDGSETGLPYQTVQIGAYMAYTDANGFYSISLPIGNYTISYTPTGYYSSGTITTSNVVANVTQNGQTYGNNNIGLYMTPGQVDLGITISPSTTVTPGFGAWYSINVCNNGTTPTGATVLMQYDAVLTPNYQSPAGSSVNTTNNLITWNVANINPGACYYIWVSFNALVSAQLGASTIEFVSVNPTNGIDNNASNNTDTIHQIVVGSWDPNNKLVAYSNTNDPNFQMVASTTPNQEIRYTVNFQNTGTAPAYNVVVVDEMSSNLDVNSYQFIGASHNCQIIRNGNTTTYKFMGIMLPDSTNNEPESHGSITYKLNALSSLNIGDQIIDYANIYFDFNAPVLTEDAVITIVGPTAAGSILNNNQVYVYPNPAVEFVNINLQAQADGNVAINITDATGKVCLQQQRTLKAGYNKLLINTAELSQGIYFVQSTTNDGVVKTSKLSIK